MHDSLTPYLNHVELKNISLVPHPYLKLVIFNYTPQCTFSRAWDEYTSKARGIIFESDTGKVIAHVPEKFFNLFENGETIESLPKEPFEVTTKEDGSMVAIWHYNDEWHTSTRGSFNSDQAVKAKALLEKYYIKGIRPGTTLITEVIYPENRIVVDYGTEEKLVLLTAYSEERFEYNRQALENISRSTGIPLVEKHSFSSIQEMVELQPKLTRNQEGFVVRFASGKRIKIKGDQYIQIHRIISGCTPLEIWRNLEAGKLRNEYLSVIPEEHLPLIQENKVALENRYKNALYEIEMDYRQLPCYGIDSGSRKAVGLFLKTAKLKHPAAMFSRLLNKFADLDRYIMKVIEPKGNKLE